MMDGSLPTPARCRALAPITAAREEGRAALFLTGRSLDDLVEDATDGKLRPIREAMRRELRTRFGLVLVTHTLAAGLDWDGPRLQAADRQSVEDAFRPHRLLELGQGGGDVAGMVKGIAAVSRAGDDARTFSDGTPMRFAWLFEFAEHLVPGGLVNGSQTDAQIATIQTMMTLATSLALRTSGNLLILHGREGLVDSLVAGALHHVRLAQPDFDEKLAFLQASLGVYTKATLAPGLTPDAVARLVTRTPNRSQEAQLRASHRTGSPLTVSALVAEKVCDVERASEGTLSALDTSRIDGVALVGRSIAVAREYLHHCGKALATGDRSAPLNIVLAGPPGIGKTDLALEVARAANASAFEVLNPKAGIVGETERRARLQRLALTEWTPNVSVVDEVTEVMPLERSGYDGDAGASRAVMGSLLTLLSDESRRGKAILIGTTNTPWLVSAAMRSRFTFVPVLAPVLPDLPAVIVALARRIVPTAKVDATQPQIQEAAQVFFKNGASPRDIGRSLRAPITPKSILEAAKNFCGSADTASAPYAELWAIKATSSRTLFPWAKDPGAYPYPEHLKGLVDAESGALDRGELDRRIDELRPHAHV
jgi:hypothetical protein